jgi:hypothetical protein
MGRDGVWVEAEDETGVSVEDAPVAPVVREGMSVAGGVAGVREGADDTSVLVTMGTSVAPGERGVPVTAGVCVVCKGVPVPARGVFAEGKTEVLGAGRGGLVAPAGIDVGSAGTPLGSPGVPDVPLGGVPGPLPAVLVAWGA